MRKEALVLLVVVWFGFGILAPDGFSATSRQKPKKRHISEDVRVDASASDFFQAPSRALAKYLIQGRGYQTSCEDIQPGVGAIIQHDQIGDTWYDLQKNGSVGRMISVTNGGYRHFSWTYADHPYPPGPRYVDANCKDPLNNYLGQVHADGGDVNAGYSNQTHLHDGVSVVINHRRAGSPIWVSVLTIDDDLCDGLFTRHWDLPDWIQDNTSGEEGMWPKAEVLYDPVEGIDYIHIVMTEGATQSVPVMVAYERCYLGTNDTLICQSYVSGATQTYRIASNVDGLGHSAPISHFDSSCSITPVVAVSPVSQRVSVAYLSPCCDRSCEYLSDVCWLESADKGDDWIDGTQWPPAIHNVTNFGCTGDERAYHDLSACFDYNDSLHIVYVTCGFDPQNPGFYEFGTARLYHWSKASGIIMIASAIWDEAEPGAHNLNIAKMSISAQDPVYHPGGDSTYLYSIWSQFDTADYAENEYTNSELYGCGSFDGGQTWGRVFNLTNTGTPGCAPGECLSEHWSSMATSMYDGDPHIQYICDRHPPQATRGSEWTENPVMYLHLSAWEVNAEAEGLYRIEEPAGWYNPPLKVTPGGYRTLIFKVFNLGNANLIWSASGDHPCILGSPGGIVAPADSAIVTMSVSGIGACNGTFIDGIVILTTNEGGGPHYDYLPVQAVVADDYYECPRDSETVDTLSNGVLKVFVNANCGESIHDVGSFSDTTHEIFFEGGSIVATTSGGDTLVGRYMREDRYTGARDKLYTDECDVDWEPDFWIVYTKNVFMHDFNPPADYKWYWWELSKQVKFFKDTAPDVYKHLAIKYVKVRRHNPPGWWPEQSPFTGYEDTYVGVVADIDCPWDSSQGEPGVATYEKATNEGGYDDVNEIAWQRGFGSGEHPGYNDYYCGIALADADGDGPETIVPCGSYCVKNNHYVHPQGGWGWKNGQLYWLASQTGNNIEAQDSLLDRSTVFTAAKIDAGDDPDAEASFTVILAAAPGGLGQLQEYVDSARAIVERERNEGYPVVCGDVNGKQGVSPGDIVYLINYLYRAGPPPVCPVSRGDVSRDGTVNSGDIVYMIGYLLRGGPVPDCPGIWGP